MGHLKNGIPSETYYWLLDWKDKNLSQFQQWYGKKSLNDLTVPELFDLYERVKN